MQQQQMMTQILLRPKSLILHNHSRKSYTLHYKSSNHPNFTGKSFPPPQPESKVKRLSTFGFNPKPQFEQRNAPATATKFLVQPRGRLQGRSARGPTPEWGKCLGSSGRNPNPLCQTWKPMLENGMRAFWRI